MSLQAFDCDQVIATETEVLTERRRCLQESGLDAAEPEKFAETKFGIALSGGGIRSATINLGFLKTFNLFKLLQKADYLSTVSGGGYCGSYIHAMLKERGDYSELFSKKDIDHMRSHGAYLIPGQSATGKLWNTLILTVGYFVSLLMSLLSPTLVIFLFLIGIRIIGQLIGIGDDTPDIIPNAPSVFDGYFQWVSGGALFVFTVHLLSNLILKFQLGVSRVFNRVETLFAIAAVALLTIMYLKGLKTDALFEIEIFDDITSIPEHYRRLLANIFLGCLLGLAGLFLNPNALSFHRFYRNQLAEAFLRPAENNRNLPLHKTFSSEGDSKLRDYLNPYPLINTCLNLQSPGGGEAFKGSKANDYFLLSPLYCGAKLVDYVKTKEFPGYKRMTLPAATTISAAAVNPGMGNYSNKVLSVVMTLLNARLGFWVNNPKKRFRQTCYLVWWPAYFFYELFSKIGTDNRKLNISDGGHIENLGVYELLRRKCRLIIAVDAGADPDSNYADLNNLTIRARNELGISIQFRERPEDMLTPAASDGYAKKRFVIADLYKIWEEFTVKDENDMPFTYRKVDAEGKVKVKEVEALVNYRIDADEKVIPQVDLKIKDAGVEIEEETVKAAYKAAVRKVRHALNNSKASGRDKLKTGTMVYVKSSVLAPKGKPYIPRDTKENKLLFDTYKYKIYHPDFPHESTADQFFDEVQWESYYRLGQYMAAAVLNCKSSDIQRFMNYHDKIDSDKVKEPPSFSIESLISWLDEKQPLEFEKAEESAVPTDAPITRSVEPEEMIIEESSAAIDYTIEGQESNTNKAEPAKRENIANAIPEANEEVDYEM